MKAVKKIEISVLHKRITPIVYAVQGDTGREIECTVVDWDIPAGVTARVWVVKPSKKVVYNDCRIVDKAVFVPMTNQTLAEPGGAICMIEFVSGEDVVSSFSFNLYVYESASGDGIPSENESTVLEGMFEELAQDAIKTLNEAKAQAAAAKKSAQDTEKIKNDFTLTAQQATADVNNAGQTQTQRVNTAGDTQVSRIQSEGTTQVQNVQATAAEIAADREQIHTNRDNTARLQRTTAGAITRSAEGSFITLDDAADGMGFKRLEIEGETRQVATTGAQMFNAKKIANGSYDASTGTLKQVDTNNTTASSAKVYACKNGDYIKNLYKTGDTGNHTYTFAKDDTFDEIGIGFNGDKIDTAVLCDLKQEGNYTISFGFESKNLNAGVLSNIMLNAGATALPWEPYTGNRPSPSPEYPQELENVGVRNEAGKYKVKVTACKNNLLDMTGAKGATDAGITATVNPDGSYTSNGTATSGTINIWLLGNYIQNYTDKNILMVLAPGKTYRIVDVVLFTGTDYAISPGVFYVDPQKYPEGYKVTGVRHPTLDSGTVLTNKVYHPRVILGDTDTGWEPYRGHTATITSDRPLTKWDKLICRDGVWGWAYGGKIKVFTGSEPWSAYENVGYAIYIGEMKPGNYHNDGYSNYFRSVKGTYSKNNQGIWFGADNTSALYVLQVKEIAGTVAEWKTWLSTHPLTLQYQLAAEEWAPLTDQEQAAMNALCTYAGTTHIWTDDPLQPVISLDYTVDTEGYIRDTTPTYRDVAKFALTGEASGTVATCTDSAEWPLLGVGMLGKCEQVSTTGAQLLECADTEKVSNGTKLSITNGNVHLTGTATGSGGRLALIVGTATLIPGTYTLCASEKTNCKSIMCVTDKANTESMIASTSENLVGNVVFTLAQKKDVIIGVNVGSGIQYNESFKVMLNAGDTALPWEPYTGAAPSPSPAYKQEIQETGTYNPETGMYEAVWRQCGDNIFDMDAWYKYYYAFKQDIFWETIDGRKCLKWRGSSGHGEEYKIFPLRINKGHKIRFSFYSKKQVVSGHNDTGMFLWGKDGTNILGLYTTDTTTWTYIEKEIVLNEDCYGMIMAFSYNDYCYFSDISLTVDSDNTEYQPYQSDTLRLTADQPWRGIGDIHDEVCDRDGVLGTWRRLAVVDNGKWETCGIASGTVGKRFRISLTDIKKPIFSQVVSSHFVQKTVSSYGVNGTYIATSEIGYIHIRVEDDFPATTTEEFRAWAQENGLYTIYLLETPVWEPFPEDVQRAYRKLKSYAGTTHAWVDDPLQPEVSFKYVKDSKAVIKNLQLDIAEQITDLQAQIDQLTINNNL